MRAPLLACAIALATLALPAVANAQSAPDIDGHIRLAPTGAPSVDAPGRFIRFNDSTPGKVWLFDLQLAREYTTIEVRATGFQAEAPTQIVPSLLLPEDEYPLFHDFPNERVWEVDAPANVFHASRDNGSILLRLGVTGPRNVTLALTFDTTPPVYRIGERQNMTHIGYYQESTTEELALANLQVRRQGAEAWVDNPTPVFHFLQRFPVQGLDAETTYETRFTFTDRAGNSVTSPIETFTTPPAPDLPRPTIEILSPAPNSTMPAGTVTIRARIVSNDSHVSIEGVRVFFDKRETRDFSLEAGEILFTPDSMLQPGKHSVSIEATNEAGGRSDARWTFEVAGENGAPLGLLAPLAAIAIAVFVRRRGP